MPTNTCAAPNPLSDEELVRATLAGDEQAWKAIVERVYASAQDVAASDRGLRDAGLHGPDHIEAIKLDTLERVVVNEKKNLHDFLAHRATNAANLCTLDGWFKGNARYAVLEHIRAHKRRRFGVVPHNVHSGAYRITKGIVELVESLRAQGPSPTGVIAAEQLQERIVQPIKAFAEATFTATEKYAMRLLYDEGLEPDEFVQRLNSRPGGLRKPFSAEAARALKRKLVARCRKAFRSVLSAKPLLNGFGRRRKAAKRRGPK